MADILIEDRFGDPDEIRDGINEAEQFANAKPVGSLAIRSVEVGTRGFSDETRQRTYAIDTGRLVVSRHVMGPEIYLG